MLAISRHHGDASGWDCFTLESFSTSMKMPPSMILSSGSIKIHRALEISGTGGNMSKNPDKFECLSCWNEKEFHIGGIERVGDSDWNVLLTCVHCLTSMNYRFHNFHWHNKLLKTVKGMIIEAINRERPTSYIEWDLKSGKVFRQSENTKYPGLYRFL